KEIRQEFPGDLESAGQLMTLQMRDRDWRGAEETLAGMREAGRKSGGGGFEAEMAEGVLREAREQWAGAEAAYERAGKIRPEAPEPLMALVRVQLAQKKAKADEDLLRQVLSGKHDHPYAHGLLGEVLLLRGDAAGAERELQEAARLKPDWTAPWTDLAGLKLSRKNPLEAVGILERGVKANPKADDLRTLLAMAYGEAGRPDQAIAAYEAVLKNNPKAALAANNLAVLLAEKKGDPASLRRALELTREFEKTVSNPLFLDTLGWVYVKMGQNEEALRVLRKAVKQVPGHPELNYHLGMACYQSGKTVEARDYLNRALRSDVETIGLKGLFQVKPRSCFDKLSTNCDFNNNAVRPELVEGRTKGLSDRFRGPSLKGIPMQNVSVCHSRESGNPGFPGKVGRWLFLCAFLTFLLPVEIAHAQEADPPGPEYRLGPEDLLQISVWRDDSLTREVVVRPDGMISFPLLGDLPAEGKSVEEMRSELVRRLSQFVSDPFVTVAVLKVNSYKIYVIGKVQRPGEYLVGHPADIVQALSLAGGLTPFASKNRIQVLRRGNGGREVYPFRYGDIEKGRDLDQNILLERGDVIVVP
ncbi:MAG: tetratricopeptide repeat protein, partial [Nitrospirae bacterium]|nr:tetratricopeptide repeat protein [Nitrospirota bacterium]